MTEIPEEKFSSADVQAAIAQWLEFGEHMFRDGHQKGYFSGSGWAARCLRAHLSALMSDRWQPIETAPKDRNVLLWDGDDQCVAWWGPTFDDPPSRYDWIYAYAHCGGYSDPLTFDRPTHWAELLPPPKNGGKMKADIPEKLAEVAASLRRLADDLESGACQTMDVNYEYQMIDEKREELIETAPGVWNTPLVRSSKPGQVVVITIKALLPA